MVERVKYLETLTDHWYDVTQPVAYAEDQESRTIALDDFSKEINEQCDTAFGAGWYGWNRADLCPIPHLVEKMKKAFQEGDVIKVGVYLMMLHGRGVDNFETEARRQRLSVVAEEIATLITAEEIVAGLDGDESAHSKVLVDIRCKINKLNSERTKLLALVG